MEYGHLEFPMQARAREDELTLVYAELRRIARRMLAREPYQHTLESCELVHLAWARVLNGQLASLADDRPSEVVALAVKNMRRVLLDHARRRRAQKRPTSGVRVSFDNALLQSQKDPDTLLEIDRLLKELQAGPDRIRNAERKAEVARYALYGGLTEAEISEALSIPKSTVGNDVRFARAWLMNRLQEPAG